MIDHSEKRKIRDFTKLFHSFFPDFKSLKIANIANISDYKVTLANCQ